METGNSNKHCYIHGEQHNHHLPDLGVLLYGCESWRMTKRDANKLDVFLHKSVRRIMKIYWPMKTSNEEIRNRVNISTISEQILRRRWKFIGHIPRMDPSKHPKNALIWAPEGRRRHGKSKETWRRTSEKERTALGFSSWSEATVTARDRAAWRKRVSGPKPTWGYGHKPSKSVKVEVVV